MSSPWLISDNILFVKNEDKLFYPTSTDVLDSIDGKPNALLQGCEGVLNPAEVFPSIRFSSIQVPFRVELFFDDAQNIVLRLYCLRRRNRVEVFYRDGTIVDHCIHDNVWFSVSGSIAELESLFKAAGIHNSGVISIKQYVKLVEADTFAEVSKVENHIDAGIIKSAPKAVAPIPETLNATLFKYQETGFYWLRYMLSESEGCILGDEMGLGKTMQVIAAILDMKKNGKLPVLIVAPVSLLANWQRECSKFAPSLKVCLHHGGKRTGNYRDLLEYDVVVTAYSTAVSDLFMLNMIRWELVALDEAQSIKNPYSNRTKACKSLNRERSVAVSGTPFVNHMSDIWSLMDFILPGVLGSLQTYKEKIPDDAIGGQMIEPVLSPLMLRRLVADVAQDLPEKIVSCQPIIMSSEEAERYAEYLETVKAAADSESVNLGMLQKLRMYCTHPFITEELFTSSDPYDVSVKYQRFCELMQEILERKEKVLVFTSYKKMFEVFMSDLPNRFGIKVWTINGETPVDDRQTIVDEFNVLPRPAALILNPRAAGTGLNITGANHVIHYNLEWNPSLEDQSSARAYRRGQEKTVFVYRLYYKDTVEEVVNERIERKRHTAKAAIVGNEGASLDRQDIIRALELFPTL
jgi:SNF2 family DNA or RNA helicase